MILASVVLSQYTRITDRQTTDDRQHMTTIAELCKRSVEKMKHTYNLIDGSAWQCITAL